VGIPEPRVSVPDQSLNTLSTALSQPAHYNVDVEMAGLARDFRR
jgi:hypothetical protein